MGSYHKRKKVLEEKHGKLLINTFNDDNGLVQNFVKQLQDITDEEGLKRAYETTYALYQHNNKLSIAGTRDFPVDHIDDLNWPFDGTLNKTKEVEMQMLTTDLIMK